MKYFFSRRVLSSLFPSIVLFLFAANALVANSNKNNDVLIFRRADEDIRNNSWNKIPRGGDPRKRKERHQLQTQERSEQLTVLPTTPGTDDLSHYEYTPNTFPKEEEERIFIKEALKATFLFQHLSIERDQDQDNQHLSDIVTSFEKQVYNKGDFLCKQGDTENTNYLYLIASGSCSVSVDGRLLPYPYGTIGLGSVIGDLALLYGTARAATVRAKTLVKVYRLHRTDFDHFMNYAPVDRNENSSSSSTSRAEKIKQEVSEIDSIIDRISGVKTKYDGDVIQQFKPSRKWLWRCWRGTIMQHAWKAAVGNMSISLFFMIALRLLNDRIFKNPITWPIGAIPDANHPLIIRMQGLFKMWGYTMSVTTLLLTFYLNKAYTLWRDIYVKGTKVQGRLNDISMVLACMVERDPQTGRYTDRARSLLNDVAISCRLCHAFSWAALIKRFNLLLTPRGLSRMLSRGIMTRRHYDTLVGIPPNKCGPQHSTLMWIMSRILHGMRDGVIPNDPGTRSVFINKVCDLRSTVGGIGDSLNAKVPLAYAQFVQVLVDIFLALAPFALYSELGIWSVLAVGILNIFFSGMNDLAKVLLDPLDNCDEHFYKDSSVNMDVGVLIRESNAGSNRWKSGLEKLPFKYSG